MLELSNLSKEFGGIHAVTDLSLRISRGVVFGLIGPNGSGKTTTINLISGLYKPTAGRIQFKGVDVAGRAPHVVTRRGIARTFQNMRLFANLTVRDNIRIFQSAKIAKVATWIGRLGQRSDREFDDRLDRLLTRLNLQHLQNELAGRLSLGEQKRLEIARALAAQPEMLLLDEPAGGMSLKEIGALAELIATLVQEGVTIILIEHNMRFVMKVAHEIAVLNFGRLITVGTPQQIRSNPAVIEAYLGKE